MSLNFDKIRARHEKANAPKEERSNDREVQTDRWGPMAHTDKGETKLFLMRMVCTEDGDPLKLLHFHYDVGNKSVLCPKRNFDEKCPVCEYASSLWRRGCDEDDEDKKTAAKKLFAKERYIAPMVIRGEVDKTGKLLEDHMVYEDKEGNKQQHGVRWYGMGVKSYKQILDWMMNPQYNGGDITDPDKGFDIQLKFTRPAKAGAFPDSSLEIQPFGERKLAPNKKEVARLLKSIPDLSELYTRQSTEEVQKILDEALATPTDEEGVKKYGDEDEGSVNSVDEAAEEIRKMKKEASDSDIPF